MYGTPHSRPPPIPAAPSKRPTDIMILHLSPPTKQPKEPATKLQFLDITIPHPLPMTTPTAGFDESLINLKNLAAALADISHLKSPIRDKYQGRTTSSSTQTDTIATIMEQNYALIPFTVNHLGWLG
jgi:hypothetical protein